METDSEFRPVRAGGLETHAAGGDVLVHDPQRGKVHVLNATAGEVLQLCDGSRDVTAIAVTIAQRTAADALRVRADVASVLGAFRRAGLIEGGDAA